MSSNDESLLSASEIADLMKQNDEWSFVVSDRWELTLQSLAIVSLMSSLVVVLSLGYIILKHRKYLSRFSLRISGYVALADMANSAMQIIMLQNDFMMERSPNALRFLMWLSMASVLFFIFLTFSIGLQLHLSTLTKVRVRVYMKLEKYYIPLSLLFASLFPAIGVSQMKGIYWVPQMHSFNWPVDEDWKRKVILWMCNYIWISLVVIYSTCVCVLISLRILNMWRDSIEVIEVPRMPEKWDWSESNSSDSVNEAHSIRSLGSMSVNDLADSNVQVPDSASTAVGDKMLYTPVDAHFNLGNGSSNKEMPRSNTGYLMTVISTSKQTGRPVAVRSFVDKKRFLRSVQRLACYPFVPVITQLGVVILNMTSSPTKGMYIYGTAMATTTGIFNLAVFLLNPALPEIWKESALGSK
ncbi:hypothetical protein GGI12_005261 [Dipsacomyces acuminosporus]|nr:hypothetical protein GGI12_005261 [Dipsacomyces acuminosporus]